MAGLRNQTFDDRDTNNLKYQGFWFLTGSWNASSVGETGTLSSTNDVNANVTFTFPVPAIAFYYYGIPRSKGGQYGICIDCDPNNRIFIPINGVNTTDNGQNPPVVLYSMTFKSPGIHEIIIKNEPDPRFGGNSQLTIDGIDLEVVDGGGSSSSSTTTSTSSSMTTSSTSLTTSSSKNSSSSSSPVGAIVGGVLAAVAVALAILLFVFWLRLRRKRARAHIQSIDPQSPASNPAPRPFVYSAAPSHMQQTDTYNHSRWGTGYIGQGHESRGNSDSRHAFSQPSVSTFSDATGITGRSGLSSLSYLTSSSGQNALAARTGPRRERDVGPLPIDELPEETQSTLPPDYSDVFAAGRQSGATSHPIIPFDEFQKDSMSRIAPGLSQQPTHAQTS